MGAVYAITGGFLAIVAIGFAVFKPQIRRLTRSSAI
jgi:hypothetical protein